MGGVGDRADASGEGVDRAGGVGGMSQSSIRTGARLLRIASATFGDTTRDCLRSADEMDIDKLGCGVAIKLSVSSRDRVGEFGRT